MAILPHGAQYSYGNTSPATLPRQQRRFPQGTVLTDPEDQGTLRQTIKRAQQMQAESDEHGGFMGMGL